MTRIDLMNARFYLEVVAWALLIIAAGAEIVLGVCLLVL